MTLLLTRARMTRFLLRNKLEIPTVNFVIITRESYSRAGNRKVGALEYFPLPLGHLPWPDSSFALPQAAIVSTTLLVRSTIYPTSNQAFQTDQ